MRGLLLMVPLACGCGDPGGVVATASATQLESATAPPVLSAAPSGVEAGPVVLATAVGGARLVASDGERAFWIDDGARSLMSVPFAGGVATAVAGVGAATALLVHGDDLYFAEYFAEKNEAKIFKVAKAGGAPIAVWTSRVGVAQSIVQALAIWNGGVYFADALGVSKVEPNGGDAVVSSMAPSPNIALGPEGLVVAQRSSLRPDMKPGPGMLLRILDDGKPVPLPSFELAAQASEGSVPAGPRPIGVAGDADGIYWMDAAGSPDVPVRLMGLRRNALKPAVIVPRVTSFPDGLVAHEGDIYWRANEAVMKAPKTGGYEVVVVRSTSQPMKLDSFAIAGDHLVWIDGTRVLTRPAR
jgi:hypothetical protein